MRPIVPHSLLVLALASGAGRGVVLGALVCAPLWVLLFVMHGVLGEGEQTVMFLGITLSATGRRRGTTT